MTCDIIQSSTLLCVIFWHLDPHLYWLQTNIIKNKGTSTHHSTHCAQHYSTEGNSGSIGYSLESPQSGLKCLLRRVDHRLSTALVFPQRNDMRGQWAKRSHQRNLLKQVWWHFCTTTLVVWWTYLRSCWLTCQLGRSGCDGVSAPPRWWSGHTYDPAGLSVSWVERVWWCFCITMLVIWTYLRYFCTTTLVIWIYLRYCWLTCQ